MISRGQGSFMIISKDTMRFNILFIIVLLGLLYLTLAQSSYEDCCLKYIKTMKPHMRKRVTSYRKQQLDGGCNIPAIIFTMKHGRMFCVDPREKWVQDLMHRVEKRTAGSVMRKKGADGVKAAHI
ncbi:C-C motif chemokine 7 [Triplophysa tibetana]|uniref:C-C motif chemokine 7 n=1 Tax=Triplophysa tibetana TaxID=1572043 RepID=A0A5A9P9V2_9TELE|nr:C-C motif chemokine 7 [Triplophysa tibetana]